MTIKNQDFLSFSILDCIINISVKSSDLKQVLQKIYGTMEVDLTETSADIEYSISLDTNETQSIIIARLGATELVANNISEFVFLFEKDMTIELQKIRANLLFIHSAVLEYKGQGLLLVAPSGTGKSTTSWAMLNSGFNYLSDELAPIDLESMEVLAYPHALCLKAVPPIFKLPDESLYTKNTIHVPTEFCNQYTGSSGVTLAYIFFLKYDKDISEPQIESMSTAKASAGLYANSLNILAHDDGGDNGLYSAVSVARKVKSYSLKSNHLDKTCKKIKLLLDSATDDDV